jgi:beta-N-acetylhexosaminidase
VLLPGFDGTSLPDWVAVRLRKGLAGVCLFGGNISSRAQLRALTAEIRAANPDAVIAIDEEGGDVTRLDYHEGSPYPGAAILGRIDDLDLTWAVGRAVGDDLASVGATLGFAPVGDINSDADNPVIGVRSFGSGAEHVARHVGAWTQGLQSASVAACAKHFPGHGDTGTDSHRDLPVVDLTLDELRRRDLRPFAEAVSAGIRAVMTSHILLPRIDPHDAATFSSTILGGILRDELGFEGVIVSDALDMAGSSGSTGIPEAAVRALAAGCDLLCLGTDSTPRQLDEIERALDEAMSSDRLDRARIVDAAQRVQALVEWSSRAPITTAPPFELDPARTARSFDVAPSVARSSRIWPVLLHTEANAAIGTVPWGPFAGVDAWTAAQVVEEGDILLPPADGSQLWLVGRDIHRHAWVRQVVDRARALYPDAIVVDMGWPDDARRYADIATFGASRHAGSALRGLEVGR